MSLWDNLQTYNTGKHEDSELLDKIYKNVSRDYMGGSVNSYKIDKIAKAFDEGFDNILMKFEHQNGDVISDIKSYIMKCNTDITKCKEIEMKMKQWGLFFPGIGVVFLDSFITRYRTDFTAKYSKRKKNKLQLLFYLEYLFLVRSLSISSQTKQLEILEEAKGRYGDICDLFVNHLLHPSTGNTLAIDRSITINKSYIEGLKDEVFLLKTIKCIYDEIFIQNNYNDYENDLKKLYLFHVNSNDWVDINKLSKFFIHKKLELLRDAYMIEEIKENDTHIIRLTELAISMINNGFIDKWATDKYFLIGENMVLVPYNANPILISKYILHEDFILEDRDFIIILKRKET